MPVICVSRLNIIVSDNGLSPSRRQAIILTKAGILQIGPLGTNFSEILIIFLYFHSGKCIWKMSSQNWRPFCLGLNVLTYWPRCGNNFKFVISEQTLRIQFVSTSSQSGMTLGWMPQIWWHYNDVIMIAMASQITCLTIVLSNRLFRRRSKIIPKLRVIGLCEGNSQMSGEFPAQGASNVEHASIWWRHHGLLPSRHQVITRTSVDLTSTVSPAFTWEQFHWEMCCDITLINYCHAPVGANAFILIFMVPTIPLQHITLDTGIRWRRIIPLDK